MNTTFEIDLFKSLFKGREDVFAIRWEKGNKNGYMPGYSYDPYRLQLHKRRGGTFQNFNEKKYIELSDEEIAKHLKGDKQIGVYPLLKDNTSWFIAADFDKENWAEECRKFLNSCKENNIPAYLERSRSGKGGHVWIFFSQPYPAIKSRKIFVSILEKSGILSAFEKTSSFDRLFPNQDFLSGKGLGNLIALPLFKNTLDKGNNCFIDPSSLHPYPDQWEVLKNIQRISTTDLDKLFQSISNSSVTFLPTATEKLSIRLNNVVKISRIGLTAPLVNFLKEELNFYNTEYIIKKKAGKNTYNTNPYFKFIEEKENEIIIPRGFIGRLIRFCREKDINYNFYDERKKHPEVLFTFDLQLREHQEKAIDIIAKKDLGIIEAPPGSGKTIIGLKIIADKKQPALIITHRKQIAEQWIERIQAFLGIEKNKIGRIGQGKTTIGNDICVAMIQSLAKELEKTDRITSLNSYGTIIIDECHHIPAATYSNTISKLQSFYLYGLTATPFRKYNDGKLISIHLGEVIAKIKPQDIGEGQSIKITIRNTDLNIPFNPKTDNFETLSKFLVHDSARNKLILNDINTELKAGKKAVIITERKDHIDSLYQLLKQNYEAITLSGEDSESSRNIKWRQLKAGDYQVIITTGQFFGEGTDLQNANCLFLVYPFSFEGKLIQYIGRVQRSEITPTIYDYRDIKIDYLNRMFLKRNAYYQKIYKHLILFEEPSEKELTPKNNFKIEKEIKVPFIDLEFRYGGIAFKYIIPETANVLIGETRALEFDIENIEIRPEFEVLKPYFSKALKIQNVTINIFAEFENGKLISQLAISTDIRKINREIIEGVKFQFINKNFIGKENNRNEGHINNINSLQENNTIKLYNSGDDLLNDILKGKNYKHKRHLQYLADQHQRTILKIRFILSPFSFIFLLEGKEKFHFVLETLDTEEATYIWFCNKNIQSIPEQLKEIDECLTTIKNKGKQTFLTQAPSSFSRIIHDYSDERKGFIIWKDILEERLI